MLSSEDREKLLQKFNMTGWDYLQEETLESLFRNQARRHPDNIAIVYQHQTMTYKELDERSNQLANALLDKGIKEGKYVPVWLDRSLEWAVAVLGIIKTGAAYVPIDPAYPVKRVEYILSDTSAEFIITNHSLGEQLTKSGKTKIFELEQMSSLDSWSSNDPALKVNQNALAYTIYTSGYTSYHSAFSNLA